jgi:hypothetical protein
MNVCFGIFGKSKLITKAIDQYQFHAAISVATRTPTSLFLKASALAVLHSEIYHHVWPQLQYRFLRNAFTIICAMLRS